MSEIEDNLVWMRQWFGDDNLWKTHFNYGFGWAGHEQTKLDLEKFFFKKYIPSKVENLLEIAVGYGRATRIVQDYCNNLFGTDLNQNCIDYCRSQFPHGKFEITDGISIPFHDTLFDLIFSYDSLVHADKKIIEIYIQKISKRLKVGGLAMIHHACSGVNIVDDIHDHVDGFGVGNRSNMTKEYMLQFCKQNGLRVISQEDFYLLSNEKYNDTITVFTKDI